MGAVKLPVVLVPVLVESWQIECCWEPFGLGDTVTWGLLLEPDGRYFVGEPVDLVATATPTELAPMAGGFPVTLERGGLRVLWVAPEPHLGEVHVQGILREDHHTDFPSEHPLTSGVVRRIQVVARNYQLANAEQRMWALADDAPMSRDVDTAPKWFEDLQETSNVRRVELGVVVDLEVDD